MGVGVGLAKRRKNSSGLPKSSKRKTDETTTRATPTNSPLRFRPSNASVTTNVRSSLRWKARLHAHVTKSAPAPLPPTNR